MATKAWYEESFGSDYLLVYKHRDIAGAAAEVRAMIGWLGLAAGTSVLDLCCGMGRHSLALAEAGYRVTGVDLSDVLLREAHKADPERKVQFLKGDMRDVPLSGPYGAIVNLFTSFGYFDREEENRKVLLEMERLLVSGGAFLIDFLNASYVAERLVPYSERLDEGCRIEERRFIEDGFVRKRIDVTGPDGTRREYTEQVKLYGLHDFERMLAGTSLRLECVYGGYDGSAYDPRISPRLIMTGRKLEDSQ